jgi:hypothetical protein
MKTTNVTSSSALLAAVVTAVRFAAQAQPVTGLHIGSGAGLTIVQAETDASEDCIAALGKSLAFNLGATGIGASAGASGSRIC